MRIGNTLIKSKIKNTMSIETLLNLKVLLFKWLEILR